MVDQQVIAVIGIACRFPGANTYRDYWHNLVNGINSITEIPADRWPLSRYYSPDPVTPNTSVSKWGGFIQGIDQFDASFFNISPREAMRMDPQQRILLELAWACFEDAGYAPAAIAGSQTGVFVGICNFDYEELQLNQSGSVEGHTLTGNHASIAPNRISYLLNLQGPSLPFDTACSSALTALHAGINALRDGDCDLALVGGINVMCSPTRYIELSKLGMLSPTGQCRSFDAGADGYVRGEGAGMVLLKPLTQAMADRDPIYGVIRSSAINHGGLARTLTSPNVYAQSKVIRSAISRAQIPPNTITYIETHGTGTPLGDPIEINGLKRAFTQLRNQQDPDLPTQNYCALGAAKTAIGHLEAAAGMSGLIKVLLTLKYKRLPPNSNFQVLNPRIQLNDSPFFILDQGRDWEPLTTCSGDAIPRRAGLSSFGFGGVNAHVILEEAPAPDPAPTKWHRLQQLFTVSAKSQTVLAEWSARIGDYLEQDPDADLESLCFTHQVGRAHFNDRLAIVCSSTTDLRDKLTAVRLGQIESPAICVQDSPTASGESRLAFLFTGQGSQYVNMGRELYDSQPIFQQTLNRCAEILDPYLEHPLLNVLFEFGSENSLLHRTDFTQPALFAMEYALAQMWMSWGIQPATLMGHSVGEYVAACLAGVFSLEDGLKLIAARGRLMQSLNSDGAMVSALADEATVETAIGSLETVAIAAYNGPSSLVFSGERLAVGEVTSRLEAQGIKVKALEVSQAFHSPLMDPMLTEFEQIAQQVIYLSPQIPVVSNVTGELADDSIATASYWVQHVRQPVKFQQGIQSLHQQGCDIYLEIGARPILLGMGRQCLPENVGLWLPTLRPGISEWQQLLQSLGQLYAVGLPIDWVEFNRPYAPRKLSGLPTYPFECQRYWIEEASTEQNQSSQTLVSPVTQLLETGDQDQLMQLLQDGGYTPDQVVAPRQILEFLISQHQQQAILANLGSYFYQMDWISKSTSNLPALELGHWVIVTNNVQIGSEVGHWVQEQGGQYTIVEFNQDPALFLAALESDILSSENLQGILHIWQCDEVTASESVMASSRNACLSLMQLIQHLNQQNSSTKVWMVTQGAIPDQVNDINLSQATLWGLGRVIVLEHPDCWGGLIDLDPQISLRDQMTAVIQEILNSDTEDQVMYRRAQRWVPRLVSASRSTQNTFKVKSDGSYLITGGSGSLGLKVAQWMINQGAQHLVLLSRRGSTSEVETAISAWTEMGASVQVIQGDVTQPDQVARAIEQVQHGSYPLCGVIHAAGSVGNHPLATMTAEQFESVLKPKVEGGWILHQQTQHLDLELFVCFSSIAAMWGSQGQGHYAAGNAFLDALVHYRRQLGLAGISINWGPWSGGGMATENFQEQLKQIGVEALDPQVALQALGVVLQNNAAQTTVVKVDWSQFRRILNIRRPRPFLDVLAPAESSEVSLKFDQTTLLDRLAALPSRQRDSELQQHLQEQLCRVLNLDPSRPVKPEIGFFELGMDSLMAVDLKERLEKSLGVPLPASLAFDAPNLKSLAAYLSQDVLKLATPSKVKERRIAVNVTEPIAIIGMACRMPGGVTDPQTFWTRLAEGYDAIRDIPDGRWDVEAYYDPDPSAPGKSYSRRGGFLDTVDEFDPQFFGITPREATYMDPQHRLLLEVSWEALEDAGTITERLEGSNVGVFVGITLTDYNTLLTRANRESGSSQAYGVTGGPLNAAAGRIAYTFGFTGPAMAVDTACSSSLVALHQACQSLRRGECETALAGGVNLIVTPDSMIATAKAQMLSPDGHCKTFDATADGIGRGEGCGMIVLKPLSQALADQDPIHAVIRSSAVNQDGPSSGFTVPNGRSQQRLIEQALAEAQVSPSEVGYIEAHGTGTALGDPIEVTALGQVFSSGHSQAEPLLIGSVKANIGHLESAAGISGIIKVILALKQQAIPPHRGLHSPNPRIDWAHLSIEAPTRLTDWPQRSQAQLAGVSSFGASGTNAHVLLAAAPEPDESVNDDTVPRPLHLLTLSAKSAAALQDLQGSFHTFLTTHRDLSLKDLCYSSHVGRGHFAHRLGILASSIDNLMAELAKPTVGDNLTSSRGEVHDSPTIAFLFTGQGSQYIGMGKELYETQPIFRQALDQCAELVKPYLPDPLLEVVFATRNLEDQENLGESFEPLEFKLNETQYTQPALFALEYSLAQMWISWGIQPQVMMGHSVGEYVAACIADVFSLADGLKLITARARLMQALSSDGSMVSALATAETVQAVIDQYPQEKIAIAAFNGPESIVFSGDRSTVIAASQTLETQGIKTKSLAVSQAFHSPLMDPILSEFATIAQQVTYSRPQISILSNVTGQLITDEISRPEYWVQHIRQPVRFAQGVQTLHHQQPHIYLEIGPKPVLLGMARQCVPEGDELWLPSLRPSQSDWAGILQSLTQLYTKGVKVNWSEFHRGDNCHRLHGLPTYPFQRQRYWVDTQPDPVQRRYVATDTHPLLGEKLNLGRSKDIYFDSTFSTASLSYMADHRIFEHVIVPGATYIEMALAAGFQILKSDSIILENIAIEKPLILTSNQTQIVQLILSPQDPHSYSFEVGSLDGSSDDGWTVHATGRLVAGQMGQHQPQSAISEVSSEASKDPVTVDTGKFYQQSRAQGIDFGPQFQSIDRAWRRDRQESEAQGYGQIRLHDSTDSKHYHLHPILLDGGFQLAGAVVEELDGLYLPVGVERLRVYRQAGCQVNVQVKTTVASGMLTSDLQFADESGTVIAEVSGFTMRQASRESVLRSLEPGIDDKLYQIEWQPQVLGAAEQNATTEPWLIFAPQGPLSSRLEEALKRRGEAYTIVTVGNQYHKEDPNHYQVNPLVPDEFQQVFKDCGPVNRILHLWSLEGSWAPQDRDDLQWTQALGCGSILHLLQALHNASQHLSISQDLSLLLVTKGAQLASSSQSTVNVPQASIWGLGRVIALEYPELTCHRLDLDPDAGIDSDLDVLLAEMMFQDPEDQIAYRQEERHVARLVRYQKQTDMTGLSVPEGVPLQLKLPEYGSPDNLILQPLQRQAPGAGEVEVQVKAVGLNFRDVLNSLGVLKDYYAEAFGITEASDLTFGFEAVGTVSRVGEHVTRLAIGDEVLVVLAHNGFSSYLTIRADFVVKKPSHLNAVEAATIPLVFLTAYYGLTQLAQLQPGERVLIHAAAGGIGQSALQIARLVGAEIYATASPPKWDFLRAQGITHIMNSRTLEFADQVMALTEGQGIHVALNSLNGDFIPKTLETLTPGGRFIEIGKAGIWSHDQVRQKRSDVGYYPFDLGEVGHADPSTITHLFEQLLLQFEQGQFTPLHHQSYPIPQVVDAFRLMQQGKHRGKVVITMPEMNAKPLVRPDASYLITGGLGALGLQAAQWLVEQGAQSLVLTGRRDPSPEAQHRIDEMRATGATVAVELGDIAIKQDVQRILSSVNRPLRGILHAAGVLDDGLLQQQSWDRLIKVMAPKVEGSWYLHTLTQGNELDWFVCFSSVAALLGSTSQGSYAAANAFMDGLVHHRHVQGLSGLSINWGPWAEGGMAASLGSQLQERIRKTGFNFITTQVGWQALAQVLQNNASQIGIMSMDWTRFLQQSGRTPFLAAFGTPETDTLIQTSQPEVSEFLSQWQVTPESQQLALLIAHLRSQIARTIGLADPDHIQLRQPLFDLGLDSLLAVELRNNLQKSLGQTLRSTLLFHYPTVEDLANYLLQELNHSGKSQEGETDPTLDQLGTVTADGDASEAYDSDELDLLSQDELADLLAKRLTDI